MRQSVFSKLRKNCRRMTTGKKASAYRDMVIWVFAVRRNSTNVFESEVNRNVLFPDFHPTDGCHVRRRDFNFPLSSLHRLACLRFGKLLSKEKPLSNYLLNRLNKVIKQHHNGELLLEKTSQSGPGHPELVGWKGRRFWESFVQNLIDGASYLFAFGFA